MKQGQLPKDYYDKGTRTNPLQWFWHHRRFAEISKLIKPVSGQVLDIGCADGTFTQIIQNKTKAKKITGIDLLTGPIAYARKKFKNDKRFTFLVGSIYHLPFKKNAFEVVFCLEVLEHLKYPQKALAEMRRVLRPDGYVVVLVPTDSFLFETSWWVVLHSFGKHWQNTHLQSFKGDSLPKLAKEAGFKIKKRKKFLLGMLEAVLVTKREN